MGGGMKGEQINFIEEIEKKERDDAYYNDYRQRYMEWLKASDLFIKESEERRKNAWTTPYNSHYDVYRFCHHFCKQTPAEKVYIWNNPVASVIGDEYWVLNEKSKVGGERILICPYCGADLQHGKGDLLIAKSLPERWENESIRKYYKLDEILEKYGEQL